MRSQALVTVVQIPAAAAAAAVVSAHDTRAIRADAYIVLYKATGRCLSAILPSSKLGELVLAAHARIWVTHVVVDHRSRTDALDEQLHEDLR